MTNQGRKWARSLVLAAAVGWAGVCLAQAVDEVWVNRPSVEIREGKGAAFGTVATARKGDKLTVLERDERGWLKVQFGDKQGYIFQNAISAREVKGGGLGLFAGSSDTSGLTTGAAGKGLDQEAETYAQAKGYDPKVIDRLIERRQSITGAEWDAFAQQGQVGPYKQQ